MTSLYREAELVRQTLEKEMIEFDQAKEEMSTLRRKNLVLWKHIKKQRHRTKKASKHKKTRKSQSPNEGLSEDEDDP